jgi:hypothetical protein
MDNKLEQLKKHEQLLDLMVNHGYVPQGSNMQVVELSNLFTALGKGKVNNSCGSCIFDMARNLYITLNNYKEKQAKEVIEVKPIIKHEENPIRKRSKKN